MYKLVSKLSALGFEWCFRSLEIMNETHSLNGLLESSGYKDTFKTLDKRG